VNLQVSGGSLKSSKAFRWTVGVGIGAIVALGLVLMFLLTQATGNRELYERNYALLLVLNVAVAGLLLLVIGWIVARLLLRLRRGRFGSRLLVKLAAIFALVGLMPGLMIYVVSYQFVSRSIESWFDVEVEGALAAGPEPGPRHAGHAGRRPRQQDAAGRHADRRNARRHGGAGARAPARPAPGQRRGALEPLGPGDRQRRRVAFPAQTRTSFGAATAQRAHAARRHADRRPGRGGVRRQWRAAAATGPAANAGNAPRVKAIAVVNNPNVNVLGDARFLQVTQLLPEGLVANAIAVQEANREYQERALARGGLRKMYIGTLTLSLFLAVFGAVLLAVVLGNQLAKPLLVLAEGVRQVAQGDLTPKAALRGKDELGGLTRSLPT
jgi:hypothetical protein